MSRQRVSSFDDVSMEFEADEDMMARSSSRSSNGSKANTKAYDDDGYLTMNPSQQQAEANRGYTIMDLRESPGRRVSDKRLQKGQARQPVASRSYLRQDSAKEEEDGVHFQMDFTQN